MRILIILIFVAISGCAQKNIRAFDGVSAAYPEATTQLAGNAASHLASVYPPGRTDLFVETSTPFGEALDGQLRQQGFNLSKTGIRVNYKLDFINDEVTPVCYTSLMLPDGTITQSYSLGNGLVIADNNFSKTGLNSYSATEYSAEAYSGAGLAPQPIAPVHTVASTPLPALPLSPAPVAGNQLPSDKLPPLPVSSQPMPVAGKKIKNDPSAAEPIAVGVVSISETPTKGVATVQIKPTPNAVTATPPAVLPAALTPIAATMPYVPASLPSAITAETESAWEITPGMLKPQLEKWSVKAGYQVVWKASNDYDMQSSVIFRDNYIGAVKRLFTRLHLQGNPVRATIYKDNSVIEVVED